MIIFFFVLGKKNQENNYKCANPKLSGFIQAIMLHMTEYIVSAPTKVIFKCQNWLKQGNYCTAILFFTVYFGFTALCLSLTG